MAVVTTPAGLPLWSDYPEFVRRHLLPIGVLMAIGLLVGLGWTWSRPPSYSATASVAPAPVPKYVTPSTTGLAPPEVTIDTDAQLLRSPAVLDAVASVLGVDADTAGQRLSVSASPNTRVLHVTVTASTAGVAAAAADAAAAALTDVRRDSLGALHLDQLRRLRLLVDYQDQQLEQHHPGGIVIAPYDRDFAQLQELRANLEELERARTHPVEQVRTALRPRHADYPNTEVPVASGAMVGLLCGCLVGAGRDRRRPTTHHRLANPRLGPHPLGHQSGAFTTRDEVHHHAH
jgi:hypothetical protein